MIAKTKSDRMMRWLSVLSVVFWALCCRGATIDSSTDGETHFLRVCTPESDDCGPNLACTCGVCSSTCTGASDCSGLHQAAECVSTVERLSGSCDEPQAQAICDVPCGTDRDCGPVASGLECQSGFCRKSSDLEPDGASGTNGAPLACPEGEVSGGQVVVLGDVFVAQTHAIVAELESLAQQAGALGPSENYRDYSSPNQNSLSIEGGLLLSRYTAARDEAEVKVVVMNGGGSDALARSCGVGGPTPDCPFVLEAVAGANQLLSQMASDGVEDVVWFYYPDPMDQQLRAELDVLRPLLEDACAQSPVACHWVDLRPSFDGHFSEYMQSDFVPTAEGARAAAAAIWATMERDCIAQ